MSKSTHMSLERGVLFFEDGTEVSNVSEELIKAAPELLEALRRLVDWATNPETTDWLNRSGVLGNYGTAVVDARAAIAKATGEQ